MCKHFLIRLTVCLFIFHVFVNTLSSQVQIQQIEVGINTFYLPKAEVRESYVPTNLATQTTGQLLSGEVFTIIPFKVKQYQLIPSVRLGFGVLPIHFNTFIDKELTETADMRDMEGMWDAIYSSLGLGLTYTFLKKEVNSYYIRSRINAVYFFPKTVERETIAVPFDLDTGMIVGNGDLQRFFTHNFEINQDKKVFFTPTLEIGLSRQWKENLLFNFSIGGTYSKQYPIDASYELIGANESLTGTIRQQYLKLSLNWALVYTFENK